MRVPFGVRFFHVLFFCWRCFSISNMAHQINEDIRDKEQVLKEDDIVDEYFAQVKRQLIQKIAANPAEGEYALDLLMIAKYFERIGDHAENIAEWVIFMVTGEHKEGT